MTSLEMGDLPYDEYLQEYLRRPYSPPPGPAAANSLRVPQHGLNILVRSRLGDPPGGITGAAVVGGAPPYPAYINGQPDPYAGGYYNRVQVQPPHIPAIPLPPHANVQVMLDVNDNRYWQLYGGQWPNPAVPRPYPYPHPRPNPPPPPCPGQRCAAAAPPFHCHGTCGNCGHVGCGANLPYVCVNRHIHNLSPPQSQGVHGGSAPRHEAPACPHHGCAHHACAGSDDRDYNCDERRGGRGRDDRGQPPPVRVDVTTCCRCHHPPGPRDRGRDGDRDRDRQHRDWDRGQRIRGEYVGGRFRPDPPPGRYDRFGPAPWDAAGW